MRKLILSLVVLCPFLVGAQTAQWTLKPKYSSITPYGENLLKVKLYNKVGLISKDGKEVVPVTADSITPLTEDIGLVLALEGEKYRLLGWVNGNSNVQIITQEIYVNEYPFFSEGKLPVCNKKGMYGFMDVKGRMVLDFDYGSIHPFSEGWAAVSKGSVIKKLGKIINADIGSKRVKMYYVNERGQFLTLQSDIDDIYMATTFKNGEALVMTKDNRCYFINTSGNIIRMGSNVEMKFDKKYALSIADEVEEVMSTDSEHSDGPTAFVGEGGLYGYRQGDKIILPPQFSEAFSFTNGCAIAARNGLWGILRLTDGDFQCKISPKSSANTSGETVNYTLTIPSNWNGGRLLLYDMTNGEKKVYTGKTEGQSAYEFSVSLPTGKRDLYIGTEDLFVWSEEQQRIADAIRAASSVSNSDVISVRFSANSVKANAKDMSVFNVIIRNDGQEKRNVTVKITGDRLWGAEKALEIEAGKQVAIPVTFYKIAFKERRSVNVAVSGMVNMISKKIEVNPFYEDF